MHIINDCCPQNGATKKRTLTIEKQQKIKNKPDNSGEKSVKKKLTVVKH